MYRSRMLYNSSFVKHLIRFLNNKLSVTVSSLNKGEDFSAVYSYDAMAATTSKDLGQWVRASYSAYPARTTSN